MFVLALLVVGTGEEEKPREAAVRCVSPEENNPPGQPASLNTPAGYTDNGIDRFFRRARAVVGDRWSHEEQGCVEDSRLTARFGVAELTASEKSQILALAPGWLRVDVFETDYSQNELRVFGDRAQAAIEGAQLERLFQGYYATDGKLGILILKGARVDVTPVLDRAIPPDSYFLEYTEPMTLF